MKLIWKKSKVQNSAGLIAQGTFGADHLGQRLLVMKNDSKWLCADWIYVKGKINLQVTA